MCLMSYSINPTYSIIKAPWCMLGGNSRITGNMLNTPRSDNTFLNIPSDFFLSECQPCNTSTGPCKNDVDAVEPENIQAKLYLCKYIRHPTPVDPLYESVQTDPVIEHAP